MVTGATGCHFPSINLNWQARSYLFSTLEVPSVVLCLASKIFSQSPTIFMAPFFNSNSGKSNVLFISLFSFFSLFPSYKVLGTPVSFAMIGIRVISNLVLVC